MLCIHSGDAATQISISSLFFFFFWGGGGGGGVGGHELISSVKGSTIERRGLEKVIATRLLAYLAAYIAFPPSRFL